MAQTQPRTSISRHIAPDFADLLTSFDLDAYDDHHATIYGLRSDLTLAYVNATWSRFAMENHAPRWLLSPAQFLNRSILPSLYGPLRSFYEQLFEKTLQSAHPTAHEYECSSPDEIRLYHMDILPIPADSDEPRGLLIINSSRVPPRSQPEHSRRVSPCSRDYVSPSGFITSCGNCRRFRRVDDIHRWDWIPRYLNDPPAPVTHGLCPVCLDYYYPVP